MIAAILVVSLLTYCPAAVWALRTGGLFRLWVVSVVALIAIVALAVAVSSLYSVPSTGRVVIYALALISPAVLCTAASLTVQQLISMQTPTPKTTAYVAGVTGLIVGVLIVVYGLRVW